MPRPSSVLLLLLLLLCHSIVTPPLFRRAALCSTATINTYVVEKIQKTIAVPVLASGHDSSERTATFTLLLDREVCCRVLVVCTFSSSFNSQKSGELAIEMCHADEPEARMTHSSSPRTRRKINSPMRRGVFLIRVGAICHKLFSVPILRMTIERVISNYNILSARSLISYI